LLQALCITSQLLDLTTAAIYTLVIICGALIVFALDILSIDIVAMMIMAALVIFQVITPEEAIEGFSNSATMTVAFMFVISAALFKTGALQYLTFRLAKLFERNFTAGMLIMMLFVALVSALINNTPIVAIFIPVLIQIAKKIQISPKKMLIPLSFAAIFGGLTTLIGTSTNLLVSGIAEQNQLQGFSMFTLTPIGLVLLGAGVIYLLVIGIRLLPKDNNIPNLSDRFKLHDYLTQITLLGSSPDIGKQLMYTQLVRDFKVDVLEIIRGGDSYALPQGDFILQPNDQLIVKCTTEGIKALKELENSTASPGVKVGNTELSGKNATLVELIITSNSILEGKTLRELDFRRRFRSVPLAIRHRNNLLNDNLYDAPLQAGDVILADVKNHFVKELKRMENSKESPFLVLSEEPVQDFHQRKFVFILILTLAAVVLSAMGLLSILIGSLCVIILMLLTKTISTQDMYSSINWKIIFMMAGTLTMGQAMHNSGLDTSIANFFVTHFNGFGPIIVLSGFYLLTSFLTEIMSNTATAALMTPIALSISSLMGVSYLPFIVAVAVASSASFLTPIGYQTNAMVHTAGQYKFLDFAKTGALLSLIFWIISTLLIPVFYPF
jgi:di/tricarboxylate transporter